MKRYDYAIHHLHGSCDARILTERLQALPGVHEVYVNPLVSLLTFYAEEKPSWDADLSVALEQLDLELEGPLELATWKPEVSSISISKLGLSVFVVVLAGYLSLMGPLPSFLEAFRLPLQGIGALLVGGLYSSCFINGAKALFRRQPNQDSLFVLSYFLCFLMGIGQGINPSFGQPLSFFFCTLYPLLFTLGRWLEQNEICHQVTQLEQPLSLLPAEVKAVRNYRVVSLPLDQVTLNESILVEPNEVFPCDGVVTQGYSTVDESFFTFDEEPQEKTISSPVYAGTKNKDHPLTCRVKTLPQDSHFTQTVAASKAMAFGATQASEENQKNERLVVLGCIGLALAGFGIWLMAGQTLGFALNVGCCLCIGVAPWAWGLVVPAVQLKAACTVTTEGILVKDANLLVEDKPIGTVLVEKNGVLTGEVPVVTDALVASRMKESEFYYLAYTVEKKSSSPQAQAVMRYLKNRELTAINRTGIRELTSKGISALGEHEFFAGSLAVMRDHGIDTHAIENIAEPFAKEGKTVLCFADGKQILGLMAMADTLRPSSIEILHALQAQDTKTVLVCGERKAIVEALAKRLPLSDWKSDVKPSEKSALYTSSQERDKRSLWVCASSSTPPVDSTSVVLRGGVWNYKEKGSINFASSNFQLLPSYLSLVHKVHQVIGSLHFWVLLLEVILCCLACGLSWALFHLPFMPIWGLLVSSFLPFLILKMIPALAWPTPQVKTVGQPSLRKILFTKNLSEQDQGDLVETLNQMDGLLVEPFPSTNEMVLEAPSDVSNDLIRQMIEDCGYAVQQIQTQENK